MDASDSPLPLPLPAESDSGAETVVDVSEKILELSLVKYPDDNVNDIYIYKNSFNLIPRSIGGFGRLRTLKFFANEINVLPTEAGDLVELECLQVKVSSPGFSGLSLQNLKALKELELCKVPPRPSAFSILTDIAHLKCLTKLSVCHFSIRYLPPEIGCLKKLVDLDLSFNKLKNLPDDIASLSALRSLRVANNKLVDLPSGLSRLQLLENLDLSNNRLTSLGCLNLASMHSLHNLNLQYNKLLNCCQIPSWICCNMEGNGKETTSSEEPISSLVEVDAFSVTIPVEHKSSLNGCHGPSTPLSETSTSSRYSAAQRMEKGWKRRDFLQQRARQERLNNSRKCKCEGHHESGTVKMVPHCSKQSNVAKEDFEADEVSGENDLQSLITLPEGQIIDFDKRCEDECSDSVVVGDKCGEEECVSSQSNFKKAKESEVGPHQEALTASNNFKPKRHSDKDLDNPKPSKCLRPTEECLKLSCKYSTESFCSINDRLPDGFYDAGRDRPFMPLQNYELSLSFDSREVILVDRERDEELDAITLTAQVLISNLKQSQSSAKNSGVSSIDNLQVASVLALFVSDCFGGTDRSATVTRMRKSVAGTHDQMPFICTCSTGSNINCYDSNITSKQILGIMENFSFADLCENSLRFIKKTRNSSIVPIGTLRFGVCRHRALLMKYLCDRVDPPIPCELVRGYLDFMPHAWNAIIVRKDDSLVRMVVDACHPTDIREETDPEYFCRYLPLTRVHVPLTTENFDTSECYFPSLSLGNEAVKSASSSVIQCEFGNGSAAAKVRTFETFGASEEERRNFEYSCLGEVRILGALRKHKCIVEIYGHQLSSKWVPPREGNQEHQLLQFKILMEYVKGGSLKGYLEKLSEGVDKHVPVKLALAFAKDVACALAEVHSKHIIHRDVKSENVLIDLDSNRNDGTPIVKLCDFDRAVPLLSFSHTCCIGHLGVAPPDACVGTPRWMAPEVLQAMHTQKRYGLEADIWSYGCLLLELLTLQVPYAGVPIHEINHLLQTSQRPPLTAELEAFALLDEPAMTLSDSPFAVSEADIGAFKLLLDLFYQCTRANPADRPTARHIYDVLSSAASSLPNRTI